MPRLLALSALALTLAACGGEGSSDGSPTMLPGSDCLTCHTGGQAPRFTAGGTIFNAGRGGLVVAGATVTLTGAGAGETVTLTTNSAGNFYTAASLTAPISIDVSGNGSSVSKPSHHGGACGSCHFAGNPAAPDQTHVGVCASCH